MKGKLKYAIQAGVKNKSIKNLGLTTLMETITEVSQESVTQYNVGSVVESSKFSWDRNINAGLTAMTTTPVMFGGGKTVNAFAAELTLRLRNNRNKKGLLTQYRRQQKSLDDQLASDEIDKKTYDEATLINNAVYNGFSQLDREIDNAQIVEDIFATQVRLEKDKIKKQNLQQQIDKIKKKYGIRNNVSLSANPDAFATQTGSTYASSALEEEEHLVSALDDVQLDTHATEIAEAVLGDMRIIKPDGSLNISKLSRLTNQSKTNVRRAISRMEQQLQDYDNEKNN